MKQLIFKPEEFEKTAGVLLPRDSSQWVKVILDEFYRQYPELTNYIVNLDFKGKDAERGYAVGAIDIEGIIVPVIVENYELYPFDVAFIEGAPVPFIKETIQTIFKAPYAFSGLKRSESETAFDSLFTRGLQDIEPLYKRSSVSVLGSLKLINKDKLASLQRSLQNPRLVAGLEKNGTVKVLSIVDSLKAFEPGDIEKEIRDNLPRTVQLFEKLGRNKYRGRFANPSVDDTFELDMTEDEFKKSGGDKLPRSEEQKDKEQLTGNYYPFLDRDGGLVLDQEKVGHYAYLDSGGHKAIENFDYPTSLPHVGDYGILKIGDHITSPFFVEQTLFSNRLQEIQTTTGLEKTGYVFLKGIDEKIPHEELRNTYYVPRTSSFIKLAQVEDIERTVKHSSSNFLLKTDKDSYSFVGQDFEKYGESGHTIVNVSEYDAKWTALMCGAGEKELEKISEMKIGHKLSLNPTLPASIDEVKAQIEVLCNDFEKRAERFDFDFVKEASVIDDITTVDAMLSLKLMTPDNIMEFVQQLPIFEQAASYLAKLLVMIRLGLKIFPEDAVKKGMRGLGIVVEILRALSNVHPKE